MFNGPKDWGYFNLATHQEIYRCSGKEAIAFLNNYCTQELIQLATPGTRLGAFLTQKGKLVSDALILKLSDQTLLLFEKGYGKKVRDHLRIYLDLADIVMEEVTKDYLHLVLLGHSIPSDLCPSLNPKLPGDGVGEFSFQGLSGRAWVSDRFGAPNLEMLMPEGSSTNWRAVLSQAGGRPLDDREVEFLRITAGLPRMGIDMGEANLVAEVGLDKRATSFNKGCYLGQETTARVNTQGHVNRRLIKLRLEKPIHKSLPLDVFQGDQVVGHLTSVTQGDGEKQIFALGILSTKALDKAEPFRLAGGESIQKV